MFATAVRIERDLGVPSVSLNALTGHRSCVPEDYRGCETTPQQGPAPVSGVFPADENLHLLEARIQVIRLSPCRTDLPAHRPVHLGTVAGFLACCFPLIVLSDSGKPSDPEITPLIPARCAGYTTARLMAHSRCHITSLADNLPCRRARTGRPYHACIRPPVTAC